MNPEIAYECATCAEIFEDFEDAATCCGYGYYNVFFCGGCSVCDASYFTEHEAEQCCREEE